MSSMTAALRWICALSASAFVGMWFPSGWLGRDASRRTRPGARMRAALPRVASSGGPQPITSWQRPEVFGVHLTASEDSSVMLTPTIRDFLDELEGLLDSKDWPGLDREEVSVTSIHHTARVELPHRDPDGLGIELEVHDQSVKVAYLPEHVTFTRRDEALKFVEMLGDGRVVLVVRRSPVWTSMQSFRDNLALPFRKTSEPWLNLKFRTEHRAFGFGHDVSGDET